MAATVAADLEHVHESLGPPYNPDLPITCPACIVWVKTYRAQLVEQYGWSVWPDDISVLTLQE